MRYLRFVLILHLSGLASATLNADFTQQPDETLPGFKSQQVYDFHAVDNVNIFSGGLNLAIPLGPEYPLSSGLKWRLTAHYSSKLWHMWLATCNAQNPSCPGSSEYAQRAHVAGNSTLGVGWTLELGSVRPPGGPLGETYKAPDGSIHFSETTGNPDKNANLRLDPRRGDGTYVVRQADGTVLYFEHLYAIPPPANGWDFSDEDRNNVLTYQPLRYGLSRIVDRFGTTVLQVTYQVTYPASNAWKVASIQLSNPARTITFNWGTWTQPGASTFEKVDSILFPVFGGNTLTSSFAYRASGTFYRGSFDGGGSQHCTPPGPLTTSLPFLDSITQASQKYTFDYQLSDPNVSGVLTRLTLPTGGTIAYGYTNATVGTPAICDAPCVSPEITAGACFAPASGALGLLPSRTYADPGNGCSDWDHHLQFIDQSPSVITRTETGLAGELPTGSAVQVVTSYARGDVASPENPGTRIVDPFKNVRVVFVQSADGNGGALTTKHIFSASYKSGAELSRRSYTNCDGSEGPGQPVRSVVQCFRGASADVCGVMETSTLINDMTTLGDLVPSRQETWYGANPIPDTSGCSTTSSVACWQDSFTGYNATALEYTTVTRSSNSGILIYPQNATRATTTNWAPVSISGGTWLPKLYSSKTVTDAPCSNPPCAVTTNYSFDTSNGFLRSTSVSDATYGTMTHSYTRDGTTGDPLTESLSATFDSSTFTNTRTFQSGLAKSLQRTTPAGIGWKSFDVDRNASTGSIATSRDPNGLTTTYQYDTLSRLIAVLPPAGELATTYCYFGWSTTGEMSAVFVKKGGAACNPDDGAPGVGSGPFEAYQYDGMARVKRAMHRLPNPLSSGGYFAYREFRYNSAGLKSFESEWTPCGTSPSATSVRSCFSSFGSSSSGTTNSNFDFLGRAKTVLAPDGFVTTRSFNDVTVPNSGFFEIDTFNVSGQSVTSGSRKDILGRTLIVAEPNPGGIGPYSGYSYNVLDKVVSVNVNQSGGGGQTRTFSYDALGLLRSETHPEKGTTTYTDPAAYNALGNVKKKIEGGHTYSYTYDAANRPTTVVADSSTYASNSYDGQGYAGGTYPLGRLTQQNGFHPLSSANVQVVQNYAYSGPSGRLSWRGVAAYNGNPVLIATESFTYNSLGLVDTHNHSRVAGTWPVTTTYKSGLPTQIAANNATYVSSASYNPAGGLQSYVTGNGITTTITQDSHLLPRPLSISTSGADQNFSSGTYSYDGVGNVMSVGSDTFLYDARSRLTRATYASSGSQFDTLGYDVFGNLTSRTSELGSQSGLAVNTATNRLSGATYDTLGNLTLNGPDQHWYDNLSRQTQYVGIGANERYFYDASGERIARVVYASSLPQQSTQERFYNLTPCRILDTRNPIGTYGGPSLAGQGSRSFPVAGVCGIPANAKSLALNVTTVDATAANGNVRLYQTGLSYQPLGTANGYKAGYPRANQTFGSIDGPTAASFTLFNDAPAGYPVNVIVDVQGYFAPGPSTPPQTGDSWFFTLRDPQNRPSTEYRWDSATPTTTLLKDHVYLGNLLVADHTWSGTPNGLVYYTNDHLGTPRFMTEGTVPKRLATFKYRAFGLALTPQIPGQGIEFASMERDLASSDLYDHARYMGGKIPRFKSADQLGGSVDDPQSWNRYSYAKNNPLNVVDPDGRAGLGTVAYNLRQSIAAMYGITPKQVDNHVAFGGGVAGAAAGVPGGLGALGGAAEAGIAVPGLSSSVFNIGSIAERGKQIEAALAAAFGGALNRSFPVIDRFLNGVATSVKSFDLTGSSYQNASAVGSRLTGYVDKLANFQSARFAGQEVGTKGFEITKKVLDLVIAKGAGSPEQLEAIARIRQYAMTVGVELRVFLAQ